MLWGMEDVTMSIEEAAAILDVSVPTVYRMIKDGRVEADVSRYRRRSKYRIRRASVEALVAPPDQAPVARAS